MDGWMDVLLWVDGWMDGCSSVWIDGRMDEWMDGCSSVGGWVGGWMNGWMRTHRLSLPSPPAAAAGSRCRSVQGGGCRGGRCTVSVPRWSRGALKEGAHRHGTRGAHSEDVPLP